MGFTTYNMIPFLMICATDALIGAVIGNLRGRAPAGAVWGVFLGPLGWLIIALAPDARPKCPECGGVIVEGARRCKNCGVILPPSDA